jgi:hypothetical protein
MVKYRIKGVEINSPKKIYVVDGVLCHKTGDFYVPISPMLLFKIQMAKLQAENSMSSG